MPMATTVTAYTTITRPNVTNVSSKNLLYQQLEALITQNENRPEFLTELLFAIRSLIAADLGQKHVVFPALMNILNREFENTPYKVMLCQVIPTSDGDHAVSAVNPNHNDNEESGSELLDFLMELEPQQHEQTKTKSKAVNKKMKKTYTNKVGSGKIYRCPYCEKMFTRADYLTRHRRTHTGDKPYVCSFCKKGFSDPGNLKRHRRIHTGYKPFKCQVCEKQFRTKDKLLRHSSVHTGERRYVCKDCGKAYTQHDTLKAHRDWAHGGENGEAGQKKHICQHCNKSFARTNYLTKHLLVHTKERKYACKQCDKRFSLSHGLKRHVLEVHDGEKKFSCPVCNTSFSQKSGMKRHLETHTEKKKITDSDDQPKKKKTKKKQKKSDNNEAEKDPEMGTKMLKQEKARKTNEKKKADHSYAVKEAPSLSAEKVIKKESPESVTMNEEQSTEKSDNTNEIVVQFLVEDENNTTSEVVKNLDAETGDVSSHEVQKDIVILPGELHLDGSDAGTANKEQENEELVVTEIHISSSEGNFAEWYRQHENEMVFHVSKPE